MLHFFFLCGLGGLLTYCVFNGDIQRITVGYDNCKNICGIRNYVPDNLKRSDCEALDLISRPYLLIFKPDEWNYTYNATYTGVRAYDVGVSLTLSTDVSRLCVTSCRMYPHYEQYKSKCVLKKRKEVANRFFGKSGIPNFIVEVAEDLAVCWETILYIEFGCFVLSYIITTLLGFQPKAMLWLLLSTAVVLCSVFTIYMWILFGETIQYISQQDYLPSTIELQRNRTYLIFALIGTFVVVPLLFYIILKSRKKMIGCVQLYKETFKALTAMPMMFTLPILSFVFVSAIIAGWIYGSIWIESSGNPKLQRPDYFIFVKSSWNFSAQWANLIGCFWTIMFVLDCQHMVVAGATSFWYFCRDKNNLGVPIFYALYNLLRYHLGSVSLGSLMAFVTEIPRIIFGLIERLSKVQNGRFAVKCCLHWKDSVLKYSTRNAYIEVGIRRAFASLGYTDFNRNFRLFSFIFFIFLISVNHGHNLTVFL